MLGCLPEVVLGLTNLKRSLSMFVHGGSGSPPVYVSECSDMGIGVRGKTDHEGRLQGRRQITTFGDYIAAYPRAVQPVLRKLRAMGKGRARRRRPS